MYVHPVLFAVPGESRRETYRWRSVEPGVVDMPCHLSADLRGDCAKESISDERRGVLRTEVDMALRRAAKGETCAGR